MLIILCCGVVPVPNGFIITDSQTGKKNRMKMTKGTQLMVVRRWEAGKGEGGER